VIASSITDVPDDAKSRDLLVRGVAAAIRDDAESRGVRI